MVMEPGVGNSLWLRVHWHPFLLVSDSCSASLRFGESTSCPSTSHVSRMPWNEQDERENPGSTRSKLDHSNHHDI